MTPAERDDVGLLNGSRRSRIAKGSGTTVTAVNSLVKRFLEAQKMMKSMAKGGVPQIPGMAPGLAAATYGGGKRGKSAPKKAKGKSGNPAKRAQQEAEAAQEGGGSSGDGPRSRGQRLRHRRGRGARAPGGSRVPARAMTACLRGR